MTEAQQMLCLAALSYRSFEDPLLFAPHAGRVLDAVARGLVALAPVCGDWELVWGPAAYRAPLSTFDDDLMFVVRSRGPGHRYAVVVRGTNPISGFDWLLGDLWVGVTAPWPYGQPRADGAEISLSTLLGLNVLQLLQAPPPASKPGPLDRLHKAVKAITGVVPDFEAILQPLQGMVASELRTLRDQAMPLVAQLEAVRRARPRQDRATNLTGLIDDWQSKTRQELFARVEHAVKLLERQGSFNALRFLEDSARLRAAIEPGVTLLSFLTAALDAAGGDPVDVYVTGHSKGGALASTLALWLADTQGPNVAEAFQWDPHARATVTCYSYAGPTAGNAKLATHSNQVLEGRCHRIVNPLDIVPRAWQQTDLDKIATLYAHTPPDDLLRALLKEVSRQVGPLGYTHVAGEELVPNVREEEILPGFFAQFVHQHMAAYLRGMDLPKDITVKTFFGPLA